MDEKFLQNCWKFVEQQHRMLLIVLMAGQYKTYVVQDLKPKGRDFFQNEVIGAQDVTEIINSLDFHNINNVHSIEAKLENLPLYDFTFGHDDFYWLKQQRKVEH